MNKLSRLKRNIFFSGYELQRNEIDSKKIQLVNFIVVVGVPLMSFFLIVNYQLGYLFFSVVNFGVLLLYAYAFVMLRRSISFMDYAINAVMFSFLLIYGSTLLQGGILNSGFLWFFLYPIFAMFFYEKKVAIKWVFALQGIIATFFIYAIATNMRLPYHPAYLVFVSVALALVTLTLSFWYQIQMKFEHELEEKKRALEALTANLEDRVQEEVTQSRAKDVLLSHQSKLAAIGEMMNNIAHQWKQPLGTISVIVQNMQLTRMLDQDDTDIDASLEEIVKQTKLMNQTVYDFLNFTKPMTQDEAFDLNKVIQMTLDLLHPRLVAEGITLNYNPAGDQYEIFGKENEFMHILMNLLGNAREAFSGREGGDNWIEIATFEEEKQVVVQISDNAGGIPSEDIGKIFDVYFSTKAEKGGSGLGLYMCKKIVEQGMRGTICATNTHLGALFELRFACFNCVSKEPYSTMVQR